MTVHICVGGLLREASDGLKILLGHRCPDRSFYPDVWDFPGGHREVGETLEQTLVRELQEEIGVVPTAWCQLGEILLSDHGGDEVLLHLFVVTAWRGTPSNRLPDEHTEIAWFSIEDACRLPLAHSNYPAWFRRLRVLQNDAEEINCDSDHEMGTAVRKRGEAGGDERVPVVSAP